MWGDNQMGGRLVDVGGVQASVGHLGSLADFNALYADPFTAAVAGRKIQDLPSHLQPQAFNIALTHPESRAQAARGLKYHRNTDMATDVLGAALQFPESMGRAGYDIDYARAADRTALFAQAQGHPVSAYTSSQMIDKLPPGDIVPAIMEALDTPDARGMALRHLPAVQSSSGRKAIIDKAMATPEGPLLLRNLDTKVPVSQRTNVLLPQYMKTQGVEVVKVYEHH